MRGKKIVSVMAAMALAMSFAFAGCGEKSEKIDTEATLITINEGEDTVSLGYGNFVARYTQAYYDQMYMAYFGETMWQTDLQGTGTTFEDDIKNSILDVIEEDYLCKIHADEYGVSLTDEDKAAIDEAVEKFMSSNSQEALDAVGATEEYVRTYLEYETYENKVAAAVKESAGIQVSKEEAWQRAFTYALFGTATATDADGNQIEVTDEYIAQQEAAATALAEAEDFDSALENSGATTSSSTYTKGDVESAYFDAAVIEAAEALEEGQVSSVVYVEGTGYYVIRIDSDYDEDATKAQINNLTSEKEGAFYEDTLASWKEAVVWSVDEAQWALVKYDVLFKAVEAEEAADAE